MSKQKTKKQPSTTGDTQEQPCTTLELLEIVCDHMDRPGVMDLPTFMELLTLQSKLVRMLLKERKANNDPTPIDERLCRPR